MGLFFDDPLHEMFAATIALGQTSHEGAEPGEIMATCARVIDGDDDSWYREWRATAERLGRLGDESASRGHRVSAREAYLRAATYDALAYRPLFGAPVDPRLVQAAAHENQMLERVLGLLGRPAEPLSIPIDGATIPGWFLSGGDGQRPVVVATNGYDGTQTEQFLAAAVPALKRGYHCVIYDGPGQGRVLVEQGVPIRADWEHVVAPILDAVLARPDVDRARVVLTGWSLGGYLALRAAADDRVRACVADPGLYGIREGMIARLQTFGLAPDTIAGFPDVPADIVDVMDRFADADRFQHWTLKQRGFWVHGVDSVDGYIRAIADFSLAGRLAAIRCPTLVTQAESDPLSGSSPQVVAEITGAPATLAYFTAAEGAGDHCEFMARRRLDQVVFDWLDEQLA